jgi:hypothetical protein
MHDDVFAGLILALGLLWCVGMLLIDSDYDRKMRQLREVHERVRIALEKRR